MNNRDKIIAELLNQEMNNKHEKELIEMLFDTSIAINVDKSEDNNRTKCEIIVDVVSSIVGSWKFIICFSLFLLSWIIINYVN